MSTRQGYNST